MCTYNINLDDRLVTRIRPAFNHDADIALWMQEQVEHVVLRLAKRIENPARKATLSQRLRGIAYAPANFDYKKELESRFV